MPDELEQYLSSLERSTRYRVLEVLKSNPHETTELVVLDTPNGMNGPFIRKHIAADSGIGQTYARIFHEQLAGRKSASIPNIYECFETENGMTVVMEYITGKTLADWVYESNPSVEFAAHVFPHICDAVSELHETYQPPIIHRDLKPSNVMINSSGVRIIDFGIARTFRDDAERDTRRFGTPSYAPPEQFGFDQTDERSDVYALGMLLYYCLTERTPSFTAMDSQFEEDGVPKPLQMVIAKATAFDPASRYASAAELRGAFLRAVDAALSLGEANENGNWAPPNAEERHEVAMATALAPAPIKRSSLAYRSSALIDCLPCLPKPLSIAWNVLVALVWVFLEFACVLAAVEPGEMHAGYTLPMLVLVYPVLMGLSLAFLACALMHKRYIKQKVPWLRDRKNWVINLALVGGAVATLMIAVIAYAIFGAFA